jgi:hypothetical protein
MVMIGLDQVGLARAVVPDHRVAAEVQALAVGPWRGGVEGDLELLLQVPEPK